ncbi:hypothetical protein BKA62DRAFT_704794 [Auriculariales sp. MPI-PUGE-AT-0066]|nr:hypothetical protein BKA62DRAFT_704794 [Auriculariales sp. MPI-PUGE-AT-0066]
MCSVNTTSSDTLVDDRDTSRITYSPDSAWKLFENKRFAGGSQYQTQQSQALFTFKFQGSYIWYHSDRDQRHGLYQVTLDGQQLQPMTGHDGGYTTHVNLWCQSVDPAKEHTLTIANLEQGQYFTLDYLASVSSSSSSSSSFSTGSVPPSASGSFPPSSSPTVSISDGTTPSLDASPNYQTMPSDTARSSHWRLHWIALGVVAFVLFVVLIVLIAHDRRRKRAMGITPAYSHPRREMLEAGTPQEYSSHRTWEGFPLSR